MYSEFQMAFQLLKCVFSFLIVIIYIGSLVVALPNNIERALILSMHAVLAA